MVYQLSLDRFPRIDKIYSVTRRTIWQTSEPTHILIFVTEGCCSIEIEGNASLLNAGDYIFIPKNTSYIRRPIDNTMSSMYYIHFDSPVTVVTTKQAQLDLNEQETKLSFSLLNNESLSLDQSRIYFFSPFSIPDKIQKVQGLLDNIVAEYTNFNLHTPLFSANEICRFLILIAEQSANQLLKENDFPLLNETPPKLRMAILYIQQYYTGHISLEDLCSYCSISKQQMIRYFHTYLNTTPILFIIEYRISKACNLLQNTSISIKEISNELGFENQCYFSRVFTKIKGESPTVFRNRVSRFDEKKHSSE